MNAERIREIEHPTSGTLQPSSYYKSRLCGAESYAVAIFGLVLSSNALPLCHILVEADPAHHLGNHLGLPGRAQRYG